MTWKWKEPRPEGPASRAWHVDAEMSARYAAGSLPELAAWSLEKHVEACSRCAALVSRAVLTTGVAADLAQARASVLATIGDMAGGAEDGRGAEKAAGPAAAGGVRRAGGAAIGAGGTGFRRSLAGVGRRLGRVAWAAGPALRGPWIVALVLVCAGAVALAHGAGSDGMRPLLLTLAPLLPLLGVALSYGPGADPMYEISAAAPGGGLRLLLTRTAAVLGVSLPLLTAAGAVLPGPPGAPGAAAWLLPGLVLVLAALALGSYLGCRTATGIVAACWTCAVLLPVLSAHGVPASGAGGDGIIPTAALARQLAHYLSGAAAQGGWAAAGALCAGLLALRRHAFDFGPGSGRGFVRNHLENP